MLVEGPPDGDALIKFVALAGMQPPVALVVYPRDSPGSGVFYPFAVFSPEWNAMRYALDRNIPVRFCDLPQAIALAASEQRELLDEDEPPIPSACSARRPENRTRSAGGSAWWSSGATTRTCSQP